MVHTRGDLQARRTANPHLHNLPVVLCVKFDQSAGDGFDLGSLLAGKYELHLLGGQHIVECDTRLLKSVYAKSAAKDVPKPMKIKAAEIYVNLTPQEEAMVVNVANSHVNLKNQFFDKVKNILFEEQIKLDPFRAFLFVFGDRF